MKLDIKIGDIFIDNRENKNRKAIVVGISKGISMPFGDFRDIVYMYFDDRKFHQFPYGNAQLIFEFKGHKNLGEVIKYEGWSLAKKYSSKLIPKNDK